MPDSEGSQLLPEDLGSGEPVSKGFGPNKKEGCWFVTAEGRCIAELLASRATRV